MLRQGREAYGMRRKGVKEILHMKYGESQIYVLPSKQCL